MLTLDGNGNGNGKHKINVKVYFIGSYFSVGYS